MPTVTAITPRRSTQSIVVEVDGELRFRLHERRAPGIPPQGTLVHAHEVEMLGEAQHADECERRLLRLLERRGRSQQEIEQRLEEWGVVRREASAILERLDVLGLVDDDALAEEAVDQAIRRGDGRGRLAAQLASLRVGDPAAERAQQRLAERSELDRAAELIEQRFGPPPHDPATLRRAFALLARRGYDEDVSRSALGVDESL
jgi:regulatory protein